MKEFARYIGVLVMLIGVAVLVIPFLAAGGTNNTFLIIGIVLVINGMLGHIYVNNMKRESMVATILWAILLLLVPFAIYYFAKRTAYTKDEIAAYN